MEKSGHLQHHWRFVHPLGSGTSEAPMRISQLEGSGLVHLRGLTTDRGTLHSQVRVDILEQSEERFTNQEIVEEETYS
jgi:hypothetical protein